MFPRNIWQRDSDEESPRKSRRTTRRACSPHVQDAPAVLMSPSAVSAQDPDAIIYDCRPPILPVSIRMKGLWWSNVVVLAELLIQVTPPGEVSQAGETDDVQSPGLRTVRHVSQPDVLRDDAACIWVRVFPLGCNQYRPFRRLLVSTVRHTTAMGLWWPPGAPGPVPVSSCNNCMRCVEYFPKMNG